MTDAVLALGEGAGAVPEGRHFALSYLRDAVPTDVLDAAELVVTELVTNAVLHGAPPVRLVVGVEGDAARIEVSDSSRALPVRPRSSTDGMTGRGLALVDAVSDDWGVRPTPGQDAGKAVWALVTPASAVAAEPGEVDLDELLAAFDDEEDAPVRRRVTVTLGDVPTDLLLDAKAHVDNVVRELVLAAGGASSGVTGAAPRALADLVHDVVMEFAEARQGVKRQALAAAAVGDARTTLQLTLPPEAADAGERYLAALEEADAWARATRLLTIAAPPQHAAFRRWYVGSLVEGLRRAAGSDAGTAVAQRTFEQHLLAEVEHLAELQAVSDRAARLQRVTASLAGALDPDEVTRAALDDAMAELAAPRGAALLVVPDRGLQVSAVVGYPADVSEALVAAWSDAVTTPGRTAYETGRPVWVENSEDRDARFPDFGRLEPDSEASCAVPLVVAGHVVGVLRLSFSEPRLFDDDERAFLQALAAVAAQALERADLFEASARLTERLALLQAVTSALAATSGVDEVLDVALSYATGLVGARVASLSLLQDDGHTVRLVRVSPPTPAGEPDWSTFDLADAVPASEAMRSGELLWVPDLASRDARWPSISDISNDFEHAFVAVPMVAEGRTLGALTLSFADATDDDPPSRDFLTAITDTFAQALQRARTAEEAAASARRLAFLARASEELGGSLDVEDTLRRLARLTVPELADWCVVHLLQDDELTCIAVEHVDAQQRDYALSLQRRFPETLDDAGVGLVVREGASMLIPSIAQARLAAEEAGIAPDPERDERMEPLQLYSAVLSPLVARGRTLGAISLLSAESRRTYGPADQAFCEDLARRAAVAVDNARLYALATGTVPQQQQRSAPGLLTRPRAASLPASPEDVLLRWSVAQEAARLGAWELDVVHGRLIWDELCAGLFGTTLAEFEDQLEGFEKRTHPDDLPRVLDLLQTTIGTGVPLEVEFRTAPLDGGSPRHLLSRGRAVTDAGGRVLRVVGAVVDVTDLRAAADNEHRAARALAGLGDVALRLAAAEDVEDLVRVVVDQGLAVLGADGGALCVRDDARGVVRLSVSESLPEQVRVEFGELPLDGPLPGSYTARTGETVLLPTVASGLAFTPAMSVVHDGTGRSAWASLPLRTGGRLLGSLVVSWVQERVFTAQEEELLAAFAAQCAQALDRVQVLQAERESAQSARSLSETLQRSLLTRPPQPDHLEVVVRYLPASQEAQVGGDWYDAFFTPDEALCVVIGDCAGHDREAVAAMAAVRNLLRATAYAVDASPGGVLSALERTMAGLDVGALATALLGRIEQTPEQHARGVRALRWSNAGHLPPVLLSADGTAVVLDTVPDLLLGLLPDTPRQDTLVELEPGATLVLFTDGLVERRGEDLDTGVERLRSALEEVGARPLEQVCDALLARLGSDAEDDVALLAVRFHDQRLPRPPKPAG